MTKETEHGVSFSEAATCFLDPEAFTAPDKEYPDRFILIGLSHQLRVLETNLSRYHLVRGARGKYLEKARRSFETIVVDKKVAATLGGPEGITAVPEALAKSVGQAKRKGRAA